jgi:glycosyltransferase A (GT-A) superfamily protein (DUF2064 family)
VSGLAVVVVARAPADQLAATLLSRTLAWARSTAPDADYLALDGPADVVDPPPAERRLEPRGDPLGAGAMEVAATVFAAGHAPVLLVTAECPALATIHATAALDDLANGCDLVVGPVVDGGWYLLGLARPIPALGDLRAESWRSPDVMALAIAAAQQGGLEIGLLRPERRLATEGDIRAAIADPLTPEDVRAALPPD